MTITVQRTISMGHRLPSYPGICSSPHGHNVVVEVEVYADDFLDFKEVDQVLLSIIQDFDHAMVLWDNDPLGEYLLGAGFRVVLLSHEPTTENIASYIFEQMLRSYSQLVCVTVHETAKYSATARGAAHVTRRQ